MPRMVQLHDKDYLILEWEPQEKNVEHVGQRV